MRQYVNYDAVYLHCIDLIIYIWNSGVGEGGTQETLFPNVIPNMHDGSGELGMCLGWYGHLMVLYKTKLNWVTWSPPKYVLTIIFSWYPTLRIFWNTKLQITFLKRFLNLIRLFANDVIMIGSVRADWPAPFSVTIGNPRADKLGRNGFECIGRRCLVDRERCVRATFMHSAIENYSMIHLQRWLECRGIKRFGTKSLLMIISHNCQSCMCRQ